MRSPIRLSRDLGNRPTWWARSLLSVTHLRHCGRASGATVIQAGNSQHGAVPPPCPRRRAGRAEDAARTPARTARRSTDPARSHCCGGGRMCTRQAPRTRGTTVSRTAAGGRSGCQACRPTRRGDPSRRIAPRRCRARRSADQSTAPQPSRPANGHIRDGQDRDVFPQDDQSRNTSRYRLPELEYRDGLRDDAAIVNVRSRVHG